MKISGKFTCIPNAAFIHLPKVGPVAFGLYCCLRKFADFYSGECYPTINQLAVMGNVSRRTVQRALTALLDVGLVRKRSGATTGIANHYFVETMTGGWVMDDLGGCATSDLGGCATSDLGGRPKTTDLATSILIGQEPLNNNQRSKPSREDKTPHEERPENFMSEFELTPPPTNGHRHEPFKAVIFAFYRWRWQRDPPWGPAEGMQLKKLLDENPDLDVPTFKRWLMNYSLSQDYPPGERPSHFLPKIHNYSQEPIDRFSRSVHAKILTAKDQGRLATEANFREVNRNLQLADENAGTLSAEEIFIAERDHRLVQRSKPFFLDSD